MISRLMIDQAIQAAVSGGKFLAVRLERENPEAVFAAGIGNFLLELPKDATLNDVRDALIEYTKARRDLT